MNDLLADVFRRCDPAGTDAAGSDLERIRAERESVLAFLESGGTAYGFTSRVGHLDHQRADHLGPDAFLADHLHGPVSQIDGAVLRLLSAVKCVQLAHGGTGVSEHAFAALAAHARTRDDRPATGSWSSSYGAGDVVPASWWLSDVVAQTGLELRRGDFIACVNGHFVSTAYALLLLDAWADVVTRYLALLPAVPIGPHGANGVGEDLTSLLSVRRPGPGIQSAISVRDVRPFVAAVATAADQVRDAVAQRLAAPSGNPLFTFDGAARAESVSQNSYLDYGVTFAATSLGTAALVALSHVQRLIDARAAETGTSALVQAPKVAQAILEKATTVSPPQRFSSAQSAGVEDMYDASLLSVESAMRRVSALHAVLAIAEDAGVLGTGLRPDAAAFVRERFGVSGFAARGTGLATARALTAP